MSKNKKSPSQSNLSSSKKWEKFVETEVNNGSKLSQLLESASYGGFDDKTRILNLYFSNEDSCKKARGNVDKIKNKLQNDFNWRCDYIEFQVSIAPPKVVIKPNHNQKSENPLQVLYHVEPNLPSEKEEELRMKILQQTVEAEQHCQDIYSRLKERTKQLVGEQGECFNVTYNWRLRVGGTRGFRDLLLPVLHPIFGIPYIPSSTLKGAARAWASRSKDEKKKEIQSLLGMLEGKETKAAKVEFLDAFPTAPCLSIDIANPQWHWQDNQVIYNPEPHPLISLKQPQLCLGLRPTSLGNKEEVAKVAEWLKNALKSGIGSRVSAGYGRIKQEQQNNQSSNSFHNTPSLAHNSFHAFKLWTQGIYGIEPPTKENKYQGMPEFRPVAVRGMLRYWFRAVGLSIYSPTQCQDLENELFGTIEPAAKAGKIHIYVDWEDEKGRQYCPYFCQGGVLLESSCSEALNLAEKLLQLSSHLAGIGRGSRRPLHWNNPPGLRGCHWEIETKKLPFNQKDWQHFLQEIREAFIALKSPTEQPHHCSPGIPDHRQQDVLNDCSLIYLVPCPNLKHPKFINNWQTEGTTKEVLGEALDFLYHSGFKGVNQQGKGNANVGGKITEKGKNTPSTPSYVLIKSNFPCQNKYYQAVTIFGTDHPDRVDFAENLEKECKPIKLKFPTTSNH